jgi:uncharacterized protein
VSSNSSGPVILSGSVSHTLKSAMIDETLRIEVSTPVEYGECGASYPVVYLIDSHWYFPIVSQATRLIGMDGEMPSIIVVGIGYEPVENGFVEEEQRIARLRCRDLTPTVDASEGWRVASRHPLEGSLDTGRAERFLEIIEREIKPLVEAHYRVDRSDQTLAGFSLGGLFALHVLFRHAHYFHRYVASSPSLWWDGGVMFQFEADFARNNPDLCKSLFLSMGALEESGIAEPFKMVTNFKVLSERMAAREYASLRLEPLLLENETHSTGAATSFIRGLRSVFRGSP